MLNFTSDQWVIIALIFVLGLLVGGFLFSGGGRKWKQRYNAEATRRTDLEKTQTQREKEWREQDSLRSAALKDNERDLDRDRDLDRNRPLDRDRLDRDRDGDGVRDVSDRDPNDNRRT